MARRAATAEHDLLWPLSQGLENDPDKWPVFDLTEVEVFDASRPTQLADVLSASKESPRKVVGQLQPVSSAHAHLLRARISRRAQTIELHNVYRYSVLPITQPDVSIRVVGSAGWFNVKPSKAYQSVWNDMTRTIRMWEWVVNAHKARNTPKTRRSKDPYQDWHAEQLFEAYGHECFGRAKMAPEAAQRLFRQRAFLFDCMVRGLADLDWTITPLFLYMAKKFPDDLAAAESRQASLQQQTPESAKTLPIREMDALKRKHTASAVADSDEAETDEEEHSTIRVKRRGNGVVTPKANGDRRTYAMKGRSALRPSAARPKAVEKQASFVKTVDDSEDDSQVDGSILGPLISPISKNGEAQDHLSNCDDDEKASSGEESEVATNAVSNHQTTALDIWSCDVQGCPHKIILPPGPDAQLLIEEHVALHAFDTDARVQLVKKHEHASLPVSYLMDRVRMQARVDQTKAQVGDTTARRMR